MEENLLQTRQNCCRLCLAPDSECISIFNSYAADKEPLATKINNCVSIKITTNDKLSLRICHACISYLNSWQSFKNRCQTSQSKQRNWLDASKQQQLLDNNVTISAINTELDAQQQHHHQHQKHDEAQDDYTDQSGNMSSAILDGISSLKKRKSLTVYPLPAVQIKDEPIDVDEEYNKQHDDNDEIVDPTLFLERTEEEGDEPLMHGSASYDYATNKTPLALSREAACRACNLKFSTRANARRHERKLHPNLFELSSSTTQKTVVTKPTAALAAALELQRVAGTAAGEDPSKIGLSVSTQKYRQEVMNAFNRYETGIFDYDNPEKYQQLLTDEKIVFLQQNEEFLSQYQDMTCRCCQKLYATYKNFMAHMRKKYATLPRNLCFNCLKLNDSKALFISHLKRRNCINLYKVLHSLMDKNPNFASAVVATTAAAPEKVRAKELLVNKMYECKMCPQQFRLRLDFRSHVYDEHGDVLKKNIMPTQCSFCALDIEDPVERKRHHNNMDCIVTIRCITCNSKFDSHQKFLDHAYEKHLDGFGEAIQDTTHFSSTDNSPGKKSTIGTGDTSITSETRRSIQAIGSSSSQKSQYFSRMPQACPICGQQYNNYNNVLRHMESKHPDQLPQTYKCVKCGIGYPRLSNLREHMVSAHAADKSKHTGFEYIVNADAIKITDGTTPNVYTGRYDYVMKDLMSITNGGTIDDDDENAAKKMKMDTSNHSYSNLKECPICNAVFNNNIGLSNHMRSHTAAAQNAAAARNSTPNSLTITPVSNTGRALNESAQQAIFKRSLEQAADRRFRRMRCRICQRRFSSKKSYRFHMLNDHQIRNVQFIKCKLCDAEFAYEKGLKVHMFKIHNTLLKDDMIIKQYECDICSIVYRNEDQLVQHKKTVHSNEDTGDADETTRTEVNSPNADQSGISTPLSGVTGSVERGSLDASTTIGPLYWYQCKYCPSNFNTNKKLAIHINSHDEFDSNDYSCKDCGNVYSGRKSLWVHRYKKHPQIAEPSECTLCKKVFFDSQMLKNHIPTCNRKPITATGAMAESMIGSGGSGTLYKHKTGDDDDDDESRDDTVGVKTGSGVELDGVSTGSLKIKLPEVACTICGQRFTDQELFAKHIQIHEMELYTDNPLAAMFDTGPADPNQFYLDRVNDNGEYACDLCHKTFTQMTAFKVHRKWHFRGDSKQNQLETDASINTNTPQTQISHQHLQGLQAIGLMPNLHPTIKSQKRKRELKCQYCPSTFISNNNLRRHIYELHKDAIGNLPKPPQIVLDEYLCCRRCNLKFETKHDWIEHKVADARIVKPFGPFQWGCDLCGAYVSRKEKLINHIHNHMKESVILPVEEQTIRQPPPSLKQNQHQGKPNKQDGMQIAQKTAVRETEMGRKTAVQTLNEHEDKEEYEEEEILEEAVDEEEVEDDDGDGDGDEDGEADGEGEMDIAGEREGDEDTDEGGDMDGEYEEIDDEYEETENAGAILRTNESSVDGQHQYEDVEMYEEDEEEEECEDDVEDTNDDDETNDSKAKVPPFTINAIPNSEETTESEDSPSYAGEDDDDDDDDIDDAQEGDEDEEEGDIDTVSSSEAIEKAVASQARFSCDLCQVFFDSQLDLQKHVKLHFLNGPGSVTLTGIKTKTANKSRSSSSDILAVSSS